MDDHEQEYPTRDEEKAAEIAMDVRDEEEERRAGQRTEADHAGPDDGCGAEFIDGSWTYCGCPDCEQREADDLESEAGLS